MPLHPLLPEIFEDDAESKADLEWYSRQAWVLTQGTIEAECWVKFDQCLIVTRPRNARVR
jgi:hypothetical protein